MKSGVLRAHCWGLAVADFGRDPRSSKELESGAKFAFLSVKYRTTLPISRRPNFTKFEHNTSIGVPIKIFKTGFENFPVRGRFSKQRKNFQRFATSGRHNSATIIDRQKFITK